MSRCTTSTGPNSEVVLSASTASPVMFSAINAQTLITDEDVEKLRTMRREDLPGKPLVWQVALRNLLAQLTGKPELLYR